MNRYDIFFSTPKVGFEVPDGLRAIADKHLQAYSLYMGLGAWEGIPEPSYCLVAILPPSEEWRVLELAKAYKEAYLQQAVLVTSHPIATMMV